MVKSGRIIQQWKWVGRGKNRRRERVDFELSSVVYFAEKLDGTIDRMYWYLTESEALFFEAVEKDELIREMDRRIQDCYQKKNERWNQLCDKFGVDRKHPYAS